MNLNDMFMENYILLVDCTDEKGLIHRISGMLYDEGLNIISNNEFVEKESNHFFMRSEFTGDINSICYGRPSFWV